MRKHAGSWIIKFLLGAVILAFIPFGYGIYQDRREGKIASVDGEPITYAEYDQIYNNLIEQTRQSFGSSFNEEMIKMLGLKDRALNQLIDHKLMLAEARRLKFRVSDREVADAIAKMEAFQTAGVFDNRRYEYILNRYRMNKENFETRQKESMLIEKVRSFIADSLSVSDAEAMEWYKWDKASVNVDFVVFDFGRYKEFKISNEEIATYYEKNKESYKNEAKVKIRYIRFNPENYKDRVTIADEDLQDYYEANKEEFHTPKTVEARHILIKTDQNADTETAENARKKALEILKMARADQDFAQLAKQYSEGPTRDKGGYLGAFKKEDMVKPFSDKAFSMKAGEISDPVRTRFGWHIIKVEKVDEEMTLSLAEAKLKIRQKLTEERAKALAYDEAEAVYDESFEGDDLIRSANARSLSVLSTDFFTRQGPAKGIKNRAKFASTAFELAVMEISDIQDLGDGYYILQLIEKIPPKIAEFKEVETKIKADLIKQKQEEKTQKDATEFLAALKAGASMTSESAKFDLKPEATGFFTRNGSIPKIGFERELTEAAFKLSKEKSLPQDALKGKKGYYVIRFNARKEPSADGFDQEKEAIKERLLQQKTYQILTAWLSQLRSGSEISIEEDFLQ
jgi:peptidyl-prolyl cis-trans isomerase D